MGHVLQSSQLFVAYGGQNMESQVQYGAFFGL